METNQPLEKVRSLVLLEGYTGRRLREGSYYRILPETLRQLEFQVYAESSLIGYRVALSSRVPELFGETYRPKFDYEFGLRPVEMEFPQFRDAKDVELIVYDVGQGNWNEVVLDGQAVLVYDLGCTYTATPDEMSSKLRIAVQRYLTDKPILVLSHWDLDHYALLKAIENPESLFSFALVRTPPPTLTARMIFSRLRQKLGVRFSSTGGATLPRQKPNPLELYTRFSQQLFIYRARQNSSRNMSGFVCVVRTSESIAILPADHHYDQIKQYLCDRESKKNEYLVVPHHGGHAGKLVLPEIGKLNRQAIVSVGTNGYNHPRDTVMAALRGSNYNTFITSNRGKTFRGVL